MYIAHAFFVVVRLLSDYILSIKDKTLKNIIEFHISVFIFTFLLHPRN